MDNFRETLAARITAKPDYLSSKTEFVPHPELVRLADALREGRSLKEIAIRAWTYQEMHELPDAVAARMRTTFRRIQRHINLSESAA